MIVSAGCERRSRVRNRHRRLESRREVAVLTDAELRDWVAENLEAIAMTAEEHPDAAVPSCPGWSIADVVGHLAPIMMGWYRHNLVTRPEDGDFVQAAMSAPPLPDDPVARIRYLRESSEKFTQLVTSMDLDTPVWTFGPPGPARFWLLRAATETAVHRWDVEAALGTPTTIVTSRATTSVDETVRGMWRALVEADWPAASPVRNPHVPDQPLRIRATDSDRTWTVRTDGGSLVVATQATDADVPDTRIEGTSYNLMLYLWGRLDADAIHTNGPVDTWNLCVRAGV
jgi:uncharacterized protein (TIGR03083 family)